jgi:hypothetical protein
MKRPYRPPVSLQPPLFPHYSCGGLGKFFAGTKLSGYPGYSNYQSYGNYGSYFTPSYGSLSLCSQPAGTTGSFHGPAAAAAACRLGLSEIAPSLNGYSTSGPGCHSQRVGPSSLSPYYSQMPQSIYPTYSSTTGSGLGDFNSGFSPSGCNSTSVSSTPSAIASGVGSVHPSSHPGTFPFSSSTIDHHQDPASHYPYWIDRQ